jgi:hypothetical protein
VSAQPVEPEANVPLVINSCAAAEGTYAVRRKRAVLVIMRASFWAP